MIWSRLDAGVRLSMAITTLRALQAGRLCGRSTDFRDCLPPIQAASLAALWDEFEANQSPDAVSHQITGQVPARPTKNLAQVAEADRLQCSAMTRLVFTLSADRSPGAPGLWGLVKSRKSKEFFPHIIKGIEAQMKAYFNLIPCLACVFYPQ